MLNTFVRGVRRLPRRLALILGERLGGLAYRFSRRDPRRAAAQNLDRYHRRTAIKNLELAFGRRLPRRELVRIARGCFRTLGRSLMQTLRIPTMTLGEMLSLIDADTFEPAERALARGKGLIFLSAHLGAWELLAGYIARRYNLSCYMVVRRFSYEAVNELIVGIRRSAGLEIIYQGEGAKPAVLAALRRNLPVLILADAHMPQVSGVFVDFFGRPAHTPVGPAALARASGAGIVPVFITWQGLQHRVHVLPEIELVRTEDKQADLIENTQAWTRVVEDIIRRYPEQWPWFHRRWRTGPRRGRKVPQAEPRGGGGSPTPSTRPGRAAGGRGRSPGGTSAAGASSRA